MLQFLANLHLLDSGLHRQQLETVEFLRESASFPSPQS
jgi:hypothetical protein